MRSARLLLASLLLAGCGGGDQTLTPSPEVPPGAVALVGGEPIEAVQLRRQTGSARMRLGRVPREIAENDALSLLIVQHWIELEAEERRLEVKQAEVDRAFEDLKERSFRSEEHYRRALERSPVNEADIRYRIRVEALGRKLVDDEGGQNAVESFGGLLRPEYRAQTFCAEGYSVPECGNGRDSP